MTFKKSADQSQIDNHDHNILGLFDVLPIFFTTSETKRDY